MGVESRKYGPMGEDLFASACMDKRGVRRVEAFDITTEGFWGLSEVFWGFLIFLVFDGFVFYFLGVLKFFWGY